MFPGIREEEVSRFQLFLKTIFQMLGDQASKTGCLRPCDWLKTADCQRPCQHVLGDKASPYGFPPALRVAINLRHRGTTPSSFMATNPRGQYNLKGGKKSFRERGQYILGSLHWPLIMEGGRFETPHSTSSYDVNRFSEIYNEGAVELLLKNGNWFYF